MLKTATIDHRVVKQLGGEGVYLVTAAGGTHLSKCPFVSYD